MEGSTEDSRDVSDEHLWDEEEMDGEGSDQKKLMEVVMSNSQSKIWATAKKEWELASIYWHESNCICGHYITENCVIRNKLNGKELVVGNICVNKFGEKGLEVLPAVHSSLRRLRASSPEKGELVHAAPELVMIAFSLGILSESETRWYLRWTRGKGSRSRYYRDHEDYDEEKDLIRRKINCLMLLGFERSRPRCGCGTHARPCQRADGSYVYTCSSPYPGICNFRLLIRC